MDMLQNSQDSSDYVFNNDAENSSERKETNLSVSCENVTKIRNVICFAWHPQKNSLAATGSNILDIRKKQTISQSFQNEVKSKVEILDWKNDGEKMVLGTEDGFVRIFNFQGGKPKEEANFCKNEVRIAFLKWNKDGNYILIGCNTTCYIWEPKSEKEMKMKLSVYGSIIDWISDNTFAVANFNKIDVFSVESEKPIQKFSGHTYSITLIKRNSCGKLLASGSCDTTVKIWSTDRDNCVHDLKGHTSSVNDITWTNSCLRTHNQNYNNLLASCAGNVVILWDVETGSCIHKLSSHDYFVTSINLSPDGKFIVSGYGDKNVFIWSTTSGKLLKTYESPFSAVKKVTWNSRSGKAACLTDDNNLFVLNLKDEQTRPKKQNPLEPTTSDDTKKLGK
jgi:transducin (beta)-like 1